MNDDDIIGTHLIRRGKEVAEFFNVNVRLIDSVSGVYPMLINPYYFSLIKRKGDPIWRQCIPSIRELMDELPAEDSLKRQDRAPLSTINIVSQNTVELIVTNECSTYCRFCSRKYFLGQYITEKELKEGIAYIKSHKRIKFVNVVGGDPLVMPLSKLDQILAELERIPHIQSLRIFTRAPAVFPMIIKDELAKVLRREKTVYVVALFNHANEFTMSARKAVRKLIDYGLVVLGKTYILKGVNDNLPALKKLFTLMTGGGVKPDMLCTVELVQGVGYFYVDILKVIDIYERLQSVLDPVSMPRLYVSLPYSKQKVLIGSAGIVSSSRENVILRDHRGEMFIYPR